MDASDGVARCDCGAELVEGENWYPSDADDGYKVCTDCRYEQAQQWRDRNYKRVMIHRMRYEARKKGIEFTIEPEDVRMPNYCPVLGIPIIPGDEMGRKTSPSLDRIDPDEGYVPGNVQIISHRANTLKNNASSEELEAVANHVSEIEKEG